MDPTQAPDQAQENGSPPAGPPQGDDRFTLHHKNGNTWCTAEGNFPLPLLVNTLFTMAIAMAQNQLMAGRLPPGAQPGRRIVMPDGSVPPPG